MRAAGAEIRSSDKGLRLNRPIALELLQLRNFGFQGLPANFAANEPLTNGNGDIGRLEGALGGK